MMPDKEKVIKGLRCIKGDLILCVDCAYSDGNGHGTYSCKAFCANDAIQLLKEQEAVEPFHRCIGKDFSLIEDSHFDYCPYCGKPITWAKQEGR